VPTFTVVDGSVAPLAQLHGDSAVVSAITNAIGTHSADSKAAVTDAPPARAETASGANDNFAGADRIANRSGTGTESHADSLSGQPATTVAPVLVYEPSPASVSSDRSLFDVSFLGSLLGGLAED
jgi:hypothetical protein